jgi:uncharacterized membrane protein YgcG
MGCGASSTASGSTTPEELSKASSRGLIHILARVESDSFLEIVKSASPGSSSFDDQKSWAAWLEAVHKCIDAIWKPLLDAIEAQAASLSGGGWAALDTAVLLKLMLSAAGDRIESIRLATAALVDLGGALWECQRPHSTTAKAGTAASEAAFQSAQLGRLLGLISMALFRTVGVEDAAGLERKLGPYEELRTRFGIGSANLCALLDGRSKGVLLYLEAVQLGDSRLKLPVHRPQAFKDGLTAFEGSAQKANGSVGSVKLFPRFHSEAGGGWEEGEGHGPRKELFALFGEQMLGGSGGASAGSSAGSSGSGGGGSSGMRSGGASSEAVVLPYAPASRQHWLPLDGPPSRRSTERERLLRFAGWVLGQSVCNRAPLQQRGLPPLLFRALHAGEPPPPSMEILAEFDPIAAQRLALVARMPSLEFADLCELDGLEPAATSRDGYVKAAAARLLYGEQQEAHWQLAALCEGFETALPRSCLEAARVSALQLGQIISGVGGGAAGDEKDEAVGGASDFALRAAFRVAVSDELIASGPLMVAFWRVVDGWAPPAKRRLVHFITGSERLPAPGSELITITPASTEADESALLGMLPQAHTCDNLLELPNYYHALIARNKQLPPQTADPQSTAQSRAVPQLQELEHVLHERLWMAVHECAAYGIDELAAPTVRLTSSQSRSPTTVVSTLPTSSTRAVSTLPTSSTRAVPVSSRSNARVAPANEEDDIADLDMLIADTSDETSAHHSAPFARPTAQPTTAQRVVGQTRARRDHEDAEGGVDDIDELGSIEDLLVEFHQKPQDSQVPRAEPRLPRRDVLTTAAKAAPIMAPRPKAHAIKAASADELDELERELEKFEL